MGFFRDRQYVALDFLTAALTCWSTIGAAVAHRAWCAGHPESATCLVWMRRLGLTRDEL